MAQNRVLIVDDEPKIIEVVKLYLEREGFQVASATNGKQAIERAASYKPELIILDLNLPDIDGLEVCRTIRKQSNVPIIMLTGRGEEVDRIVGLELGADDYVTKPFSPRELTARVKALLRRAEPPGDAPRILAVGNLEIDPAAYRVSLSGKPVTLSTLEFRLLYFLASRPNRVFSRDQLLDAVWGTERFVTPRSVDVYVRRLREKVEPDPEHPLHLKTVRGAGYMFETRAA
jgi:phosphate regulon transcriptional regulator PhoB